MLDRLACRRCPSCRGASHPARLYRFRRRWPLAPSHRSRGTRRLRLVLAAGMGRRALSHPWGPPLASVPL